MSAQTLLVDIDQRGVATVTLNNPGKHNAFDDAMIAELSSTFRVLAADEQVRIMVLAASGKSFSAGADLNWMRRMASYSYEDNLTDANALADMLKTLNTFGKPTIARVQGAAFGGAVGLVACCDMAVATPAASFSLSEVKIGLIPATISPYVIAAIGQRAARRYFLTAERFDADKACQLGLVQEVTAANKLDEQVNEWIEAMLINSPNAMQAAKQLIFDVSHQPVDDGLIEDTSRRIANARVSPQGQEGLTAFLEKRPANWISS